MFMWRVHYLQAASSSGGSGKEPPTQKCEPFIPHGCKKICFYQKHCRKRGWEEYHTLMMGKKPWKWDHRVTTSSESFKAKCSFDSQSRDKALSRNTLVSPAYHRRRRRKFPTSLLYPTLLPIFSPPLRYLEKKVRIYSPRITNCPSKSLELLMPDYWEFFYWLDSGVLRFSGSYQCMYHLLVLLHGL